MVGKFIPLVLLLAITSKLNVEGRPADVEEKEDEESFETRCLLALALFPALASKLGMNQASEGYINYPPQEFINYPPQEYINYPSQEYITLPPQYVQYDNSYDNQNYIYVDVYQRPNGELFYYTVGLDGQTYEAPYPVGLIGSSEFTRIKTESDDFYKVKVLRSLVLKHEAEQAKREAVQTIDVPQPQFQTVPQQQYLTAPKQQLQTVQPVRAQVQQVQSSQVRQQPKMVVGTAKRGQIPAGATILGVRRN